MLTTESIHPQPSRSRTAAVASPLRRLFRWLLAPQPCRHYWTVFRKDGDWYCISCDEVLP